MLCRLPGLLLLPLMLLLAALWLALFGMPIILLGLLQLVPLAKWQQPLRLLADWLYRGFLEAVAFTIWLTNDIDWQQQWPAELNKQGWYLVIANHQSWMDVVLLMIQLRRRTPPPKFFFKRELVWVPFVGFAAWALGMPMMKRYSRSYLAKYPQRQGQDLATTRRACQRYRHQPTTVINFVEGSRVSAAKQRRLNSPFTHLLPPKAGGIAFTLAAMGDQFEGIIDVTIAYPGSSPAILADLLMGRLRRVVVVAERLPIDEQVMGDYFNDDAFRDRFQHWLNQRWQRKDRLLAAMVTSEPTATAGIEAAPR